MRVVKPASDYAKQKVEVAEKKLAWYGIRGVTLVVLALPVGVLLGFLAPEAGFVSAAALFLPGLILVAIGLTSWQDASSTRKGMQGEERVVSELSSLRDEFLVLNDVMLRGGMGNIDHIVVGPTGVFVVETKNFSGSSR